MRRAVKSIDLGKPELSPQPPTKKKDEPQDTKFVPFLMERDSMNKLIMNKKHESPKFLPNFQSLPSSARKPRLLSQLFKNVMADDQNKAKSSEKGPILSEDRGWVLVVSIY